MVEKSAVKLSLNQSALKHGRRTFLYSAMGELAGMQRETLGKSGSEAASQ